MLEKSYGEQLDELDKLAPNRDLRPKLKALFFEMHRLMFELEKANDLTELESYLEKNADVLTRRICKFNEERAIAAEIKKSELRREYSQWRIEALEMLQELKHVEEPSDDEDEAVHQLIGTSTLVATDAVTNVIGVLDQMSSISEDFENMLVKIDRDLVTRQLRRFRKKRQLRKYQKRAYIFFWGVLVFGAGLSYVASSLAKAFLSAHFRALIVFGIAVAAVKLYVINRWFRARTLQLERKHLTRSIQEFYTANIQVTVLTALHDKRIVPRTGVKKPKRKPL